MVLERPQPSGRYAPRQARVLPRDIEPNCNDPIGTVGPNAEEGFGDTHVMYPSGLLPDVQRWAGWPVDWDTPNWGVSNDVLRSRVSTVFAAIDKNADALGSMPPYVLDKGAITDEPPPWLRNPQPEVYTGWIEFLRQAVFSLMTGEVFLWATAWRAGHPTKFVVLDPNWVQVDLRGHIRTYRMGDADITGEVLHIRYVSWPGEPRGIGPLEALSRSLISARALEQYQSDLASRGGIPWGVITVEGNLTAAQANDARWQYVTSRLGARAAPAVFSGGAKMEAFNISPKDMALLELRQFDEARIATVLRCPPTLLGLPSGESSLTYQTKEGIFDAHWRTDLRPIAARMCEAISQWALPRTQTLEFDDDEYTRPPLGEYATTLASLVAAKIMTVDEARAALRLNGRRPASTSLSVGAA